MPESIDLSQFRMSSKEEELAIAIVYLMELSDKLGIGEHSQLEGSKNDVRSNQVIIRYAFEIFKVWSALFPHEHKQFIENTKYELDVERPIKEAVKAGGYSPISFPVKLDNLFHELIPKVKTQDRRFWKPLLNYIPELRRSNYA